MEFFKKRAARKAAKEKVEEAIRQADERTAAKRAVKRDEALEKVVEKQEAETLAAQTEAPDETVEALREVLADEPDKRITLTAQTAVAAVFSILQDEKGVRIEDALGIIGAFAGHMSIRAALNMSEAENEERITVLGLSNDETAMYGPAIDDFLISNPRSIFNLVGAGVQLVGGTKLPDPNLLVQEHVRRIGTDGFGIPRVPEGNQLRETPRNYLIHIWPLLEPHITALEKAPDALCAAMGVAAQDLIAQGKDAINPDIAAEIVLQSAFATSSIPPAIARQAMDDSMEERELAIQKAAQQAEASADDAST